MEISQAKTIMGRNFIGPDELKDISMKFGVRIPETVPEIEIEQSSIEKVKDTHVLVFCVPTFENGSAITIRNIRERITLSGSPCFYNQDWYLNEKFIDEQLDCKWILVSKELIEESRGAYPSQVIQKYKLHSSVELTYVFFVFFFHTNGEMLWESDYVWCRDVDDKGDQIYVGRYIDSSGLNADGFEIHRHLSIKDNYGAI